MKIEAIVKRTAPTILSAMGTVGLIATVVEAVKATPKAMIIRDQEVPYVDGKQDPVEVVKATWKCYVPTAILGAATIGCIVGADILGKRQKAALMSAYILLQKAYAEYREGTVETFGADADRRVKQAVAKGRKEKSESDEPIVARETCLFYEEHYGKYFERTMIEVLDAEYRMNRKFALTGEASLNDFFEYLGFSDQEIGDAFGWSESYVCDYENTWWVDFDHELVELDDGLECYIINISPRPAAACVIATST